MDCISSYHLMVIERLHAQSLCIIVNQLDCMTVDLERGYERREPCGSLQYNLLQKSFLMIYVGIDVAKDKHSCFITNYSLPFCFAG